MLKGVKICPLAHTRATDGKSDGQRQRTMTTDKDNGQRRRTEDLTEDLTEGQREEQTGYTKRRVKGGIDDTN